MARLKELESKKLPESLLNSLSSQPAEPETEESTEVDSANKIKTFNSDSDGSEEVEDDDSRVIEAGATEFHIMTNRDLNSDKLKNSTAWSFKQKMLYGDRVKREPHKQKFVQNQKQSSTNFVKT